MNAREAKRLACRRAARVLHTELLAGGLVADREVDTDDGIRIEEAVAELVQELDRRGGTFG